MKEPAGIFYNSNRATIQWNVYAETLSYDRVGLLQEKRMCVGAVFFSPVQRCQLAGIFRSSGILQLGLRRDPGRQKTVFLPNADVP